MTTQCSRFAKQLGSYNRFAGNMKIHFNWLEGGFDGDYLYVYANILWKGFKPVSYEREKNIVELHGLLKYKRCFFSIILCLTLYVDLIELISKTIMDWMLS
jgi:hypothetical protein